MYISKNGNTVGFTSKGETVTGEYRRTIKAWRISVQTGITANLTEPRNRNFLNKDEAISYASLLIDPIKTAELQWW
jgi:hypothetical protein